MAALPQRTSVIVEDNSKSNPDPSSVFMRSMDIVNTITHLALGSVAFAVLSLTTLLGSNKLSQHMILCVLGYVVLMAQSILVMSPNNGWSRSYNNQERRLLHLVMQIIGSVLAIAGSGVAMSGTTVSFRSTHGSLGIVAMILTILSFIGGIIHLYITAMPRVSHMSHCIIGLLTIIIAFVALIFGINDYYRFVYLDGSANLLIAITVIGLVGTLLPSCSKILKQYL